MSSKAKKLPKVLVIDNYDSFTYNLVQYLGELGAKPVVYRNDQIAVTDVERIKPDAILISPGPCTPKEAGVSNDIIQNFSGKLPILGVCLGHQCLGHTFGGVVARAKRIMHGKVSEVFHAKDPLFKDVPSPFEATRYHSLLIKNSTLPKVLRKIAWTDRDEIMGVKHVQHPTWGVQFHPESIKTRHGKTILKNFLDQVR